jgi:hypothetical protein
MYDGIYPRQPVGLWVAPSKWHIAGFPPILDVVSRHLLPCKHDRQLPFHAASSNLPWKHMLIYAALSNGWFGTLENSNRHVDNENIAV